MARRTESRLRRPTSKLAASQPSEPLPPKRRSRRGVGSVHPNSTAARVWLKTSWSYSSASTRKTGPVRFAAELSRVDEQRT